MSLEELIEIHRYFVELKEKSTTVKQIIAHLEDILAKGILTIKPNQGPTP